MLSPTSINMYLRCPRKFYLRYIRKLKTKPSIYLLRGIAVHEALAKFYDMDITPESEIGLLRLNLLNYFHEAWAKHSATILKLDISREDIDKIYIESVNMLYGWFYRFMEKASLGIQKPQTEVKLFSKKYNLMGIMDAIYNNDGKVIIVDYKTSGKDDITPEIEIQMALYALLYLENFNRKPDMIAVDFLQTGNKKFITVTNDMIDDARKLCIDIRSKIHSNDIADYPCTCGGWCEKDFENEAPPNKGNPSKA